MPNRNVVIESVRQKRLSWLRSEREEVMDTLRARLHENRARHQDRVEKMHALQREIDTLQHEAGLIAEKIAEDEASYQHDETQLSLVQWPKDADLNPPPTKMPRLAARGPNIESPRGLGVSTPVVSCFVTSHPYGTEPHLIGECEIFSRYTSTDRAQLIRRRNLCWACWLPRKMENGVMHNGATCEHQRHCPKCCSNQHHEALCGAALVMKSTYEKARRAGLLLEHQ